MNNLVTIRTFSSSVDFELAKLYLESNDIVCFSQDEIMNRVYFPNMFGAKLQVREEQFEEALKLMVDGGYITAEDFKTTPELKWASRVIDSVTKFFSK